MSEEFDLIIINGLVYDGKGNPPYKASIAVKDGKIVKIGDIRRFEAKRVIDAKGLAVSPGFIDIHSHGDETLFLYPTADSFVMQGITTIIGGNCGFTPAPLRDWWLLSFWEYDLWDELRPFKYYPEILIPLDEFKKKVKEVYGIDINWKSFNDYLKRIESIGISVNYAPLVGHNTIRAQVMGNDYKRKAKPEEIKEMKELVREAMEAGAHGLSTGLDYEPGAYADTEELIELVKVVKEYGGIYSTHWRRTGIRKERVEFRPPEKIKGILEAIEIGKKTKVPVQISHIMSGYAIYPPPPPELATSAAKATIKVIDNARKEGIDITFDVIPNVDGGVFTFKYLAGLLAPWVRELGSRENLAKALKAKDFRDEVKQVILSGKWWYINPKVNPYWAEKVKILVCKNNSYVGKTLAEIASEKNQDPIDTLFDIIIEDPDTRVEYGSFIDESEVIEFIKHPYSMICTDTFALDFKWEIKKPPYFLPHPNTYAAFPRFIRRYVRELKVITLEEAIKKITFLPAQKLKLKGRGVIEVGAYADIVIFNPNEIAEGGDYLEPRKPPKGIHYVIVNGEIVVEKGKHTAKKPGKVIRRTR